MRGAPTRPIELLAERTGTTDAVTFALIAGASPYLRRAMKLKDDALSLASASEKLTAMSRSSANSGLVVASWC